MSRVPASAHRSAHIYPPVPKDFDPVTATPRVLARHGLPVRPDARTQPGLAALWERKARRYRRFEHLQQRAEKLAPAATAKVVPGIGPDPIESCGYSLFSPSPFTSLFITWTVPDLTFSPTPFGINHFHTFVGLGFLDVHVQMSVDSGQAVTSQVWAQGVGPVNLPVRPGDVLSASICLETNPAGTAHYFLANETSAQSTNVTLDTGFPPAVTIDAGVTRDDLNLPVHPLAGFGVVYFDEISAYTTSGSRSLTTGEAITMVETDGSVLAQPVRLTDYAFKAEFHAA